MNYDEFKQNYGKYAKRWYEQIASIMNEMFKERHIKRANRKKYLKPKPLKNPNEFLRQAAISLNNSKQLANTIHCMPDEYNYNVISKALFGFDVDKYTEPKNTSANLWYEFYKEIMQDSYIDDNGTALNNLSKDDKLIIVRNNAIKTNWTKFCHGLADAVNYLSKKENVKSLNGLINQTISTANLDDAYRVVKDLKSIKGFGDTLPYDFLKEIGVHWLIKPDTHLIKVMKELTNQKNTDDISNQDCVEFYFYFAKYLVEQCRIKDATPYKIDKMIWLICTGNFYLEGKLYGRTKLLSELLKC